MNFFKDPKYRSIRVVIILVVIVGSVWFVVSNMNQSNSNQGRVLPLEDRPLPSGSFPTER